VRPITHQILERHGVGDLTPGAFALAPVDLVMFNEVSGAVAMRSFAEMGASKVFDPASVALVCDHFVPAKDARSAQLAADLRNFARRYGIDNYWEVGATQDAGIEHTLLPEQGLVRAGDLIAGGDSHTCTYGAFGALCLGVGSTDVAAAAALGEIWVRVPEAVLVEYVGAVGAHVTGQDLILEYIRRVGVAGATYAALEFAGAAVERLNVDERMALCNMAVEAGAKTGLVAVDEVTEAWYAERVPALPAPERLAMPGGDAYGSVATVDVDGLTPRVACPDSPANVVGVEEVASGTRIDQVYVGNCSNGTITDLRQLAQMVAGRSVATGTRLIVVPATQAIYRQAVAEGLIDTIVAAGGMISPPTCGACFGGHMGILAAGETALATTNRNFRGRMGHRDSRVYLANAYVAGAAAVAGELVDPVAVLGAPTR
jgi:3-isopropylmalate/(R)-2-methylmalate dehydratase large subunit